MTPNRLARGTILAAATLTIMAPALIAPSLPAMEQVYGTPLLVRLAMTITSLAVAVTAPLSGLVADRTGRRPLLVASLLLYAVSGTAGYLTTDLVQLLVTRTLLGVAVGGIMTAVNATITDWFDGPARASFLGLQQVFGSLSGVVFLPLAGVLATIGWRVPFWLYGVAAMVAACALFAVRDRPRTTVPTSTGRALTGPVLVGLVVAGSTCTSVLGGYGFPALARRLDPGAVNTLCVGLLGAGWLLVGGTGTAAGIAAGLLVGGLGVGFAIPHLTLRLSDLAPPAWRGRVFSGLVAGIFLGQFVSPLVVQPLVRTVGIADAFTWTGAFMVAGAAVARITHKERISR